MALMNQAVIAFTIFMALVIATQVWGHSPTSVEYCDGDYCAPSRVQLQNYHDQTPWTSYDATKVTVVVNQ